jgi:hypothetical protein
VTASARKQPKLSPLAAENARLRAEVNRLRLLCMISPDALATVLSQLADHSPPEDIAGHLREVVTALRGNGMVIPAGPQRQNLSAGLARPSPDATG